MFSAFTRRLPQIAIFHRPSVPASDKALELLRSAASAPYPPSKPQAGPLEFDLEVTHNLPTVDQLRAISGYSPKGGLSGFLSGSGAGEQVGSAEKVLALAGQSPDSFKWPVVVDWSGGKASIGDIEGVKEILEGIRKKRDGETA